MTEKPFYHSGRVAEAIAREIPTNGPPPRTLDHSKMMKLKHREFCEYYVHHGNAAEAAREAGYSATNARFQGCYLLRNTKVRAYIHELRQKFALETVWEMEDVYDNLVVIFDAAMADKNYHAALRALEAQTRIKMRAMRRINRVAGQTLEGALVPEAGALRREADHIDRYTRPRPNHEQVLEDMSPETMAGPASETVR